VYEAVLCEIYMLAKMYTFISEYLSDNAMRFIVLLSTYVLIDIFCSVCYCAVTVFIGGHNIVQR